MFSASKTKQVSSGYNLTKSLRFRASATAYLNRTFSTPTNNKIWTYSVWVKRGAFGNYRTLIWSGPNSASEFELYFDSATDQILLYDTVGMYKQTSAVYRDPSAWYHIVAAMDTTQATALNRNRLYVNGVEVTSWSTNTNIPQNSNTFWNSAIASRIGGDTRNATPTFLFDGYMADAYFVDGQQLTPSSFGATNATTGVWQPKAYTGSYGTNGFHLPFTNTTSTTTLGNDTSGNGNNWTTNNISLTAGSTYDSMNDVPTLTSATASNYAVFNPSFITGSTVTITNGNLTITQSGVANFSVYSAFGVTSGSWYFEVTITTSAGDAFIGLGQTTSSYNNSSVVNNGVYRQNGQIYNGGWVSYGASYTTGDVIGVAFNATSGTITFYKNNVSQGQLSFTFSGFILEQIYTGASGNVFNVNFGQQPFVYTPPSGFVSLNTYNLPTPTIVQGNKYMDANIYAANNSTNAITNAGAFKPDFVWTKSRSNATNNSVYDSVRGVGKYLYTNNTNAESTDATSLISFNSNGFTLGAGDFSNYLSGNSVAWQWQAGQGSSSSNTNGSITSTVSASTTAGFSVVTYTGTGVNATVGHGLGVTPAMIIIKGRNTVSNWVAWHSSFSGTGYILLNSTGAQSSGATIWNSTLPSSSVFSVGTNLSVNESGDPKVAYCFAQILGFSSFGSYTGNGATTGPFIYTGFQPKLVIVKNTSAVGSWMMLDTTRSPYNLQNNELYAESSSAEATGGTRWAILSNGFQITNTGTSVNTSGNTYIYMAFASNPFKYSNAF
jgi:hypothetical protein